MRITQSKLAAARRCTHAAAMGSMGYKPTYSDASRLAMNQGTLFEYLVTGAKSDRYEDENGYEKWLNDGRTKKTRERVEQYADYVRKTFLPELHLSEKSITVAMPFGDNELNGEIDLSPQKVTLSSGGTHRGLVDLKWTGSILEVWDPEHRGDPGKLLQLVVYSLLWAYRQSGEDDRRMLEGVAAAIAAGDPCDKAAYDDWATSRAEVEDGIFLICESSAVKHETDVVDGVLVRTYTQPPRVATFVIQVKPDDYIWVLQQAALFVRAIGVLVAWKNVWNQAIHNLVEPGPMTCLGRAGRKGQCPYMDDCCYGQRFVTATRWFTLSDILDS